MKTTLSLLLAVAALVTLSGQHLGEYRLTVEEVAFEGLPGVQSFAWGQHEGKWLIVGGRTDGLHRRQPWASFREQDNNKNVYVIDPEQKKVWAAGLNELPASIYEQMQATNLSFEQIADQLYILGGYGYAASVSQHITHPYLTAVDVPGAIRAVIDGAALTPFFRQIRDERVQVTGGYLGVLNGVCYLVGGQRFMGLYNPMGLDHGPGFVQEYTNQIRKFRIQDENGTLSLQNYAAYTDSLELHRRDYNLAAQVFPDGRLGFTAFSGVFQYNVNLPWLNTVDIFEEGYAARHDFNQYLNQYHTAHLSAYHAEEKAMYTAFFGGISRFYPAEDGALIDDQNVPFVRTISLVERDGQGQMHERKIGEMPDLLGSGAEFIPQPGLESYDNGVIRLDDLAGDDILLGHIFGGIESSRSNIFFINTGEQSEASNRLFAVRLVRDNPSGAQPGVSVAQYFNVYPNPSRDGHFTAEFELKKPTTISIDLLNTYGSVLRRVMSNETLKPGNQRINIRLDQNAPGLYYLRLYDGERFQTRKIIRQ